MRWALLTLILAIATLAYFFGLRFGYLTLTPTWMYNAQGENSYAYRVYSTDGQIILTGTCDTKAGQATFRLFAPNGRYLGGQTCPKGQYNVRLKGGGEIGDYRLAVQLDRYTGKLELNEQRSEP